MAGCNKIGYEKCMEIDKGRKELHEKIRANGSKLSDDELQQYFKKQDDLWLDGMISEYAYGKRQGFVRGAAIAAALGTLVGFGFLTKRV